MSKPNYHEQGASRAQRRRNFLVNAALTAGIIGAIALFVWAMFNPLKLPSNTIYSIVGVDYLLGLALFIGLLVRTSANQPLDAPTTKRAAEWESDFQSWNTSLGIRLLATDKQLLVLRRLFELGNCIDSSVNPSQLDETKRHALLELIQQTQSDGAATESGHESQVLFSALQYADRHYVSSILRGLRQLGEPSLVPSIYSAPDKAASSDGAATAIHFEEIRATAPQCVNALQALSILQSDQDTLLRASSTNSGQEDSILLRPAEEVDTPKDELLRSAE